MFVLGAMEILEEIDLTWDARTSDMLVVASASSKRGLCA